MNLINKEETYYLYNKSTKQILEAGPIPDVWGTISGLAGLGTEHLHDLSWANKDYVGLGFFTESELKTLGVPEESLAPYQERERFRILNEVRYHRDQRIIAIRWRVDRHNDELLLGMEYTEDIKPVLKYIQALRDITEQQDLENIIWPDYPM